MFGELERVASTELLIAVAVAVFLLPASFLLLAAFGALRRSGGREISPRVVSALCVTGGASIGVLLVFAPDLAVAAPLLLPAYLVLDRLRRGRRGQAGWLLTGGGITVTLVWLVAIIGRVGGDGADSPPVAADAWLAGGLAVAVAGLLLLWRGDSAPAPASTDAPAGRPGSRAIGSIAEAIREPGMLGPFGLPELAMLVAFVGVWLVVPILLSPNANPIVQLVLTSAVAAVVAPEAYIRAMPARSGRAFEAFSWLGEWELARARRVTGRSVPTTPAEADEWLTERPERLDRLDEAALRVEVLLLAGRQDAAAGLVARMDTRAATPWERFEVASLHDLVGWRAGGDGDLPRMEAAAAAILPTDSDDRLRAEVTVAVAQVRRRMADGRSTPGDAAAPLLEVRKRLGARAHGQVGRALRPRMIPAVFVGSLVLGVATWALGWLGRGGAG